MKKNVLVLLPVEARHKEKLEAAGAGCCFVYSDPDTVTEEQIRAANIILGLPKADMLKASENLEWLQLASAGTDPYIVPGVLPPKTLRRVQQGGRGACFRPDTHADQKTPSLPG